MDRGDLLVTDIRIRISAKYLYLYLRLKVLTRESGWTFENEGRSLMTRWAELIICQQNVLKDECHKNIHLTRMHSSKMRTAHWSTMCVAVASIRRYTNPLVYSTSLVLLTPVYLTLGIPIPPPVCPWVYLLPFRIPTCHSTRNLGPDMNTLSLDAVTDTSENITFPCWRATSICVQTFGGTPAVV